MMLKCGRIIVCWDHKKRPCLRPKGHEMGCNPFSSGEILSDNKKESQRVETFSHRTDELVRMAS